MMQGTPYIYQGEELGMTNVPFASIDDFRDLDSINAYHELVEEQSIFSEEEMLHYLRYKSRDNARTPFQWDDTENAGFTSGTPWIMVNPNYKEINAMEQLEREDSVFNYYKKLIRLRKENPVIVYGNYDLIFPESEEIFAYTRTLDREKLLVLCNYSDTEQHVERPELFAESRCMISNCDVQTQENTVILPPYAAVVYYIEE